jgi:hypothetical protein
MYKKCIDSITEQEAMCVKRLSDNAIIPFDESNVDYQEYLRWVEQGNTPEPSDSEEV